MSAVPTRRPSLFETVDVQANLSHLIRFLAVGGMGFNPEKILNAGFQISPEKITQLPEVQLPEARVDALTCFQR